MGLADLKKNSTQSNRRQTLNTPEQMSLNAMIDGFIDQATLYAAGDGRQSNLAEIIELKPHQEANQHVDTVRKIGKGNAPFRKATFTLSESAIAHLTDLANDCDIAKSKLIRFLIEHHYTLSESERRRVESTMIVE
ncbi:CopG family transcriptional regulator [Shewanella waksmanii]|uniref:CopG family transcriptional regulator n=1 Tax=Shewanella waksmanii TaxID=213783 RepID=UPI00373709F4